MSELFSFDNINRLLFHLGLETQELLLKKDELTQQIDVHRANIAEKSLYIDTTKKYINKLEEEISVKQKTVSHNKENIERMRAANNLLLQYDETLKEELESRKAAFSKDKEIYEERITSYRAKFQSHKEYYLRNPLAQKLLMLQAESKEIECRLKICDEQITMKQMELHRLTDPEVACPIENLPDSVLVQQPTMEEKKQPDELEKMECETSIDLASLHVDQTRENLEEFCDENPAQDGEVCNASSQKPDEELWSSPQSDEHSQSLEGRFDDQDQITAQPDDDLICNNPETGGRGRGTTDDEHIEGPAVFHSPPSRENVNSFLEKMTPMSSTSTSPLNLSSPPGQGSSETKSPYFLFSTNSNPSTPGFGFGFEPESSQDEESPFAFTGSFFNGKKTPESKSPGCPEFLFGKADQSEDFQFTFSSESPQSTNKGDGAREFPFSFNF